MIASNAATISRARATASGRSTFASTGTLSPAAAHAARTSAAASGPRTNDSATQSTPARAATAIASRSRGVSAAIVSGVSGRFSPLFGFRSPPTTTVA
jgi:hypothetical protein